MTLESPPSEGGRWLGTLRDEARRCVPPAVWTYVESGAREGIDDRRGHLAVAGSALPYPGAARGGGGRPADLPAGRVLRLADRGGADGDAARGPRARGAGRGRRCRCSRLPPCGVLQRRHPVRGPRWWTLVAPGLPATGARPDAAGARGGRSPGRPCDRAHRGHAVPRHQVRRRRRRLDRHRPQLVAQQLRRARDATAVEGRPLAGRRDVAARAGRGPGRGQGRAPRGRCRPVPRRGCRGRLRLQPRRPPARPEREHRVRAGRGGRSGGGAGRGVRRRRHPWRPGRDGGAGPRCPGGAGGQARAATPLPWTAPEAWSDS